MGMLSRSLARTQATYRKNTGNRLNIPVRVARTNNAASVAIHRLQTNSLNIPWFAPSSHIVTQRRERPGSFPSSCFLMFYGFIQEFDAVVQSEPSLVEGWVASESRHPPEEPRWPQRPALTSSPSEGWVASESRHPPEEPRWPQRPALTSSPSEGWVASESRHPPEEPRWPQRP